MIIEGTIEPLRDDSAFDQDAWEQMHTRIQAAMRAQQFDYVCVLISVPELEMVIRDHLQFLGDLGGVNAGPDAATMLEMRAYAIGRIASSIRSMATSEKEAQRLSVGVIGERIDLGDERPFCFLDDLEAE